MPGDRRSNSDAESSVNLAAYYRLKWSTAGRSFAIIAVIALVLLPWSSYAGIALAAGGVCGIVNMLAIMRGSERLVETGSRAAFGISSLLRLGGFSIVAAVVAARGPWWSLGPFLTGFFFPLAAYALGAWRTVRPKP